MRAPTLIHPVVEIDGDELKSRLHIVQNDPSILNALVELIAAFNVEDKRIDTDLWQGVVSAYPISNRGGYSEKPHWYQDHLTGAPYTGHLDYFDRFPFFSGP